MKSQPINLTDAAFWYKQESHQVAAFNYLQSILSEEELENFAEIYRAGPVMPPTNGPLTPDIFAELTGYSADKFTEQECLDANRLLQETDFIRHKDAMCMLLGNILHETGNMRWLKELASGEAYENRADLGNTQPGDGPKYKGAGVLQLTGRYNYSILAKDVNDTKVIEYGCDYVATTYPFMSAYSWIENNKLLHVCLKEGFDKCCYRINGGWNGYEDRKKKYEICKRVFNVK
jgi:predicted chitinase